MTTTTSRTARPAPRTAKNGAAVAVPHLSVAERVARGKAARAEVPRSRHAVFEPSPDRVDPVDVARTPGRDACPGAGPDPLRPDARVAVHVLPRGGADHGPGPRADAALGADGAVLRRRAPVELRRVRLTRAAAGVRYQRFRRDAPRTVGVGRQAPGREHADRRPRQRLSRPKTQERIVLDTVGALPDRDGGVRRDEEPRRVVLAPGNRERARRNSRRSSSRRWSSEPRRRSRRRAPRTA